MTEANWNAIGASWSCSPWVLAWLLTLAGLYGRGWWNYRQRRINTTHAAGMAGLAMDSESSIHHRFPVWRLSCFWLGLITIFVALQSPLDVLASFSLQIHMVQHLLLIIVAPVLLLLGSPLLPLLGGLPVRLRKEWVVPFSNWRPFRRALASLVHPLTAWLAFVLVLWGWHTPRAYNLALGSVGWHRVEHACFLTTALMFWFPVIRPFPIQPRWSTWLLLPYLFLAGVQGTVLCGILTFADHVLYPHYANTPNIWGQSPIVDQSIAGAIMWIPMSIAFLTGLVLVIGHQFSGHASNSMRTRSNPKRNDVPTQRLVEHARRVPAITASRADGKGNTVSRWNRILGSPSSRRWLRGIFLALALAVTLDGLFGPQISPWNLAGVLPWIHWRGLLVLALVLGGNFFCMACPFTTIQAIARRAFGQQAFGKSAKGSMATNGTKHRRFLWPDRLKNKWPAFGLLILFFWTYEAYALWDRPRATAVITLAYFGSAVALGLLFRDAPFCKFVCPIGQFNFVQSLCSPTQVTTISAQKCTQCKTRECIVGSHRQSGCQLELFQPNKVGNLDCTFCLDCADACPHDNVALLPVSRYDELCIDPMRSGIGRLSERIDIMAIIGLLFFAAFVNAAWMTSPVLDFQDALVDRFGLGRIAVITLGMVLTLVVLPTTCLVGIAWLGQAIEGKTSSKLEYVTRRIPSLIPLGLGMWLAHYTFHLVTSWDALEVAAGRAASQLTGTEFEVGPISCSCCRADGIRWLLPAEFVFLACGLYGSFVVLYRIVDQDLHNVPRQWLGMVPWSALLVAYYAGCLWILLQPMQMRGAVS